MNPADQEEQITEGTFAQAFEVLRRQPKTAETGAEQGMIEGNYAAFRSFKGNPDIPADLRYQQALDLRKPNLSIIAKYSAKPQAPAGPSGPAKPQAPQTPEPPPPPAPKAETASSDGPGVGLLLVAAAAAFLLLRGK